MSYSVVFEQSAIDMLNGLVRPVRIRLYLWVKKNLEATDDPRQKGRAMVGGYKGFWRYRVGDYRIIVQIEDLQVKIHVVAAGHRKDVYGNH